MKINLIKTDKEKINYIKNFFPNLQKEENFLLAFNKLFDVYKNNKKLFNKLRRKRKNFVKIPENFYDYYNINFKNNYIKDKYLYYGYSKKEAEKLIESIKKKTSGNLERYINMYGYEEGIKRYENFCKKSNVLTKQYYINKYGYEEGLKKYTERLKKCAITKENMIQKYGYEEGIKRYENWKNNIKVTKEKYLQNHTEEEWINLCKKKAITKEKYLQNHTEEEWIILCKKKAITKENMIQKYGYEEGIKRYENWKMKIFSNLNFVSKESIEFFKPIVEYCKENNIEYYGVDKKEFLIENRFYDFTIPSIKLIVEYNGSMWHYNPNYNYPENFKNPFGKSLEELKENDNYKRNLAKENEFILIDVYDTDNKMEKQKEIIKIIKKEINK